MFLQKGLLLFTLKTRSASQTDVEIQLAQRAIIMATERAPFQSVHTRTLPGQARPLGVSVCLALTTDRKRTSCPYKCQVLLSRQETVRETPQVQALSNKLTFSKKLLKSIAFSF